MKGSILRINSLNQNYNLVTSDRWIVSKGAQNISYTYDGSGDIKQRIDRDFQRSGEMFMNATRSTRLMSDSL